MFPYNLISYGAISICPIIAITLSTESLVSCSVQIEQWMSQGKGRSKKIAKRIAAENMLSMIEETEKMNKSDSSVDEAASPPYFSAVSIYRSGGRGEDFAGSVLFLVSCKAYAMITFLKIKMTCK